MLFNFWAGNPGLGLRPETGMDKTGFGRGAGGGGLPTEHTESQVYIMERFLMKRTSQTGTWGGGVGLGSRFNKRVTTNTWKFPSV